MDSRERTRIRHAYLGVLVCLCFALQQLGGPLHLLWHEHVLAAHAVHGPEESPTVEDCRDEGHLPGPVVEHVEAPVGPAVSPLRLDSPVHLFAPSGVTVARSLVETGAVFPASDDLHPSAPWARGGPRAPPIAP